MKQTTFNQFTVYISSLQSRLGGAAFVNSIFSVYISVYISVYTKTPINKGFAAFVNYVNSKIYKTVFGVYNILKRVFLVKKRIIYVTPQSYARTREFTF